MIRKYIIFATTVILALVLAGPAMAQVTEYEGVVDSINEGAGTFQLIIDGTDEYTVVPPDGFDLLSLNPGDIVIVTGTLSDTTITASSISILAVYVEKEGTVQSIDEVGGTFGLYVSETEVYTIMVPAGFDLTTIHIGDIVGVTGTLADSTITAASISIVAVYIEVTGTVQSVNGTAFVLYVAEGETYIVIPPAGYNLSMLSVGDNVMVFGTLQGGTIQASAIWVYVKVVGNVLSIDSAAFQFQIDGGGIVNVTPPGGFDLATLGVEDILLISGWHYADALLATEIRVLFRGDGEGIKGGHYCQDLDESHPVARYIAEQYGAFYQEVMSWFCVGNFGLGEIKNMFKAYMLLDGEISTWDLMAMKEEIGGWGNVWKSLGLNGSGKKPLKSEKEVISETGKKPDKSDKPHQTGKPEKVEDPQQSKKPKQTGPPEHANNDKDKDKDK